MVGARVSPGANGENEGRHVGRLVVGTLVGVLVGILVGFRLGATVGVLVGNGVGRSVGWLVGAMDGPHQLLKSLSQHPQCNPATLAGFGAQEVTVLPPPMSTQMAYPVPPGQSNPEVGQDRFVAAGVGPKEGRGVGLYVGLGVGKYVGRGGGLHVGN